MRWGAFLSSHFLSIPSTLLPEAAAPVVTGNVGEGTKHGSDLGSGK